MRQRGMLPGQALAKAKALTAKLEHMAVMCQPIDQRASEQWIAEQLAPAIKGQVGRDQQAATEVALAAELEQQLGAVNGRYL